MVHNVYLITGIPVDKVLKVKENNSYLSNCTIFTINMKKAEIKKSKQISPDFLLERYEAWRQIDALRNVFKDWSFDIRTLTFTETQFK